MIASAGSALSQFSPGELSRAHRAFEGSQNCITCHDVGQEISGVKCLSCHGEIKQLIDARKGYHGRVAGERCITCHKEHLGLDAKTTKFDKQTFDHAETGFRLDGKHAPVACERCHNAKFIVNREVIRTLDEFPRETYLGLDPTCATCHEDIHRGKFRQDCSHCHATSGWGKVRNFDHAKSRYPLEGKHAQVACAKCHPSMGARSAKGTLDFATLPYADCTPCHKSPHKQQISDRQCASCHTAQGWGEAMSRPFDHNATSYPLKGRHARLECAACHRVADRQPFAKTFFRAFGKCTDCHADRHNGEFSKKYKNDCAACHSVESFKPSSFSLARHDESRFRLTGSHAAVVCSGCHTKPGATAMVFALASLRCESCHKDVHKGQFDDRMKDASCGACHTTDRWKSGRFDHSATAFPLAGRHASVPCADCHKDRPAPGKVVRYAKLPTECASCHKDVHEGQFTRGGKTDCRTCHSAEGWRATSFDHETQSSFRLTGAHKNVPCRSCHKEERAGGAVFLRFTPLSGECASCHAKEGER